MTTNDWMVLADEEDKAQALSVLRDQLREGKISHDLYIGRCDEVRRAKYLGDIYKQVFTDAKKVRPSGVRRVVRPASLNALTLLVALTLIGGLWGNTYFGITLETILIVSSIVMNITIAVRRSKSGSVKVDPTSMH